MRMSLEQAADDAIYWGSSTRLFPEGRPREHLVYLRGKMVSSLFVLCNFWCHMIPFQKTPIGQKSKACYTGGSTFNRTRAEVQKTGVDVGLTPTFAQLHGFGAETIEKTIQFAISEYSFFSSKVLIIIDSSSLMQRWDMASHWACTPRVSTTRIWGGRSANQRRSSCSRRWSRGWAHSAAAAYRGALAGRAQFGQHDFNREQQKGRYEIFCQCAVDIRRRIGALEESARSRQFGGSPLECCGAGRRRGGGRDRVGRRGDDGGGGSDGADLRFWRRCRSIPWEKQPSSSQKLLYPIFAFRVSPCFGDSNG